MKIELRGFPFQSKKKGDVKRLRRQGKIPAVIYGHKEKTRSFYVEIKDLKKVLEKMQEETVLVNLKLENKKHLCVIKSIQHNPVNSNLLHIDFQHIHKKEKVRATVPIHLLGEAKGLKKGGILDQNLHEVMLRCLPDQLPAHIDVDISELDLGETIHLKDLQYPDLEFELTQDIPVVSILEPRVVEEVKPQVVEEVAEAEVKELPEEEKKAEEKPEETKTEQEPQKEK